ncbi:unnamed protein product [Darwinula stevensoni]|uniref:Uncharacterized protein n=1 Tax=Darwinula stevensoni TaxID=69355 RepID=A0A7R8X499_9CRUS|nr:unnamed protein product [Darwinula stevensoni]CAG0878844.1 unnamed protein product [Darwinula stevensoni]
MYAAEVGIYTITIETEEGMRFHGQNFTAYNCSYYRTCSSCLGNSYSCEWCISDNKCSIQGSNASCKKDWLVKRTPLYEDTLQLQCVFALLNGTRLKVPGRAREAEPDWIECEDFDQLLHHGPDIASERVNLTVTWNEKEHPLDNQADIHVEIFDCFLLGNTCTSCLTLEEKFDECGWCVPGNRCGLKYSCDPVDSWLDREKQCPNVVISDFWPRKGPIEGGTQITISGVNMGKELSDIHEVIVADTHCEPLIDSYITGEKVVCRIAVREFQDTRSGPIQMKGNFSGENPESQKHYEFVNPEIHALTPDFGPKSGGTLVKIFGRHLDAGRNVSATLGSRKCDELKRSEMWAECKTPSQNETGEVVLQMVFDSKKRGEHYFTYFEDPVIREVRSGGSGPGEKPRSIASGGIRIHECHAKNVTYMQCLSPALNYSYPTTVSYGFTLDGVEGFKNFGDFQLLKNPIYFEFEEDVKLHLEGYLTLDGEDLNVAISMEDVTVWIGEEKCNVTSLSMTQLTCLPPEEQPRGSNGENPPTLTVKVGRNLEYSLGKLQYVVENGRKGLSIGAKAGIGVLSVFVVLLLVGGYVFHKKRTASQKEKLQNDSQKQLEALELNVMDECKEGFTELQTEVNDFTSDLADGGIPILEYQYYALNVLFPNRNPTFPIARPSSVDIRGYESEGLELFHRLIMKREFLITFIHTLEKVMSLKERVSIASSVMIVLHGKMEYCTEILKRLMSDLIEKHMNSRSHVVHVFRRTESIVEKMMSIWISLLLYKFLRDRAGKPLYGLFRSVKHQIGKKPVDAFTHEARNCLSEEILLREKIQYKELTVFISLPSQTSYACGLEPCKEQTDVQVRVLDCDSISQVKEKALDAIFGSQPFSCRPALHKLDLQWQTGVSKPMFLRDEDHTSVVEDGWIRINTLHHYRRPQEPPVPQGELRKWHLVREEEEHPQGKKVRTIPEVYLTRLLSTKQALQSYVDELFRAILTVDDESRRLLLPIKYLFDFLDQEAENRDLGNSDALHSWKSNSVPLRFWVNIMKNPEFVFSIQKSPTVDSCLSVIAQTFMAAFSNSDTPLGKDSPNARLLYAKDILVYKKWVREYYKNIKLMPSVTHQEMTALLAELSTAERMTFNTHDALTELFDSAKHFRRQLKEALEAKDEALEKEFSHALDLESLS